MHSRSPTDAKHEASVPRSPPSKAQCPHHLDGELTIEGVKPGRLLPVVVVMQCLPWVCASSVHRPRQRGGPANHSCNPSAAAGTTSTGTVVLVSTRYAIDPGRGTKAPRALLSPITMSWARCASASAPITSAAPERTRTWCEFDNGVVFGLAHREILRAAAEKPPDLIVVDARRRGGLGLALFGSTTQEVVRGASGPC
jgi:hypothetical protein